jgi:hypothetical protein
VKSNGLVTSILIAANKVMDISDLTTEQQRIHKHEKEENQL